MVPFPSPFPSIHGQNVKPMCRNTHVHIKGIQIRRDFDVGLKIMFLTARRAVGRSCLPRNPRVWRPDLPLKVLLPTHHLLRKMNFSWLSLGLFFGFVPPHETVPVSPQQPRIIRILVIRDISGCLWYQTNSPTNDPSNKINQKEEVSKNKKKTTPCTHLFRMTDQQTQASC